MSRRKNKLRIFLIGAVGVLLLIGFLGGRAPESSSTEQNLPATDPRSPSPRILLVPVGELGTLADEYYNYDEVRVYKKDGTLDERANDLEELCLDYSYYRKKIVEYEAAGRSEKAAEARTAFQRVNAWLDAYHRDDFEVMYFEILDLEE
jgi:hypothetical protein